MPAAAPDDALTYTLLGIAHEEIKNPVGAREAFSSALRLNPNDANARNGLFRADQELRRRR